MDEDAIPVVNLDDDHQNVEVLPPLRDAKKRKSNMWNHFTPMYDASGKIIISNSCMYCKVKLSHGLNNGTSSMRKHLLRCLKYPLNIDKRQKTMTTFTVSNVNNCTSPNPMNFDIQFDPEACRLALVKMIVVDEQPFSMAEREGFRHFCSVACPLFKIPSRFTVARDCKNLFICQKESLTNTLKGLKSRISLTTDCWTSIQNLSYLCLTAHFIDDNWKLHKRIINFKVINSHKGRDIGKVVENCVLEWGIEDKLCTLTVDNASANDVAVGYLRDNLSSKFILDGEFFQMRCSAHVLNLVVRDGLTLVKESITKIRTAVRYVRSSPSRAHIFDNCVAREKIDSKNSVCLDVATRWNSTYLMLDVALKFQKAFNRLGKEDGNFANELKDIGGVPISDDWEKARVLCQFLEHFYHATKRMSGTLYATSNMHFHELFLILTTLLEWELNPNQGLNGMAKKMKDKFELYYGNFKKKTNVMVLVAVVLDPRYKLRFVRFALKKLYPHDSNKVDEIFEDVSLVFRRLYDFYAISSSNDANRRASSFGNGDVEKIVTSDVVAAKSRVYNEFHNEEDLEMYGNKGELDKYLESPRERVDGPFNILHWWKERDHENSYPILVSMAKDILAIPVSTVSSESAFSTSGRVLDQFRSCLGPKTVEALVCTQDWLRASEVCIELEQLMDDVRQYEQDLVEVEANLGSISIDV